MRKPGAAASCWLHAVSVAVDSAARTARSCPRRLGRRRRDGCREFVGSALVPLRGLIALHTEGAASIAGDRHQARQLAQLVAADRNTFVSRILDGLGNNRFHRRRRNYCRLVVQLVVLFSLSSNRWM